MSIYRALYHSTERESTRREQERAWRVSIANTWSGIYDLLQFALVFLERAFHFLQVSFGSGTKLAWTLVGEQAKADITCQTQDGNQHKELEH